MTQEQQALEDLYKDDPSNYEHDWQYRNNQQFLQRDAHSV